MKKLMYILFLYIILIGCGKDLHRSSTPTVFVIQKMSQTSYEKENKVAQYLLDVYQTARDRGQNSIVFAESDWFTLKEGFSVGDTLMLIKK